MLFLKDYCISSCVRKSSSFQRCLENNNNNCISKIVLTLSFPSLLIIIFRCLYVKTVVAQVDFTYHLPALGRTDLEMRKKSLILDYLQN